MLFSAGQEQGQEGLKVRSSLELSLITTLPQGQKQSSKEWKYQLAFYFQKVMS